MHASTPTNNSEQGTAEAANGDAAAPQAALPAELARLFHDLNQPLSAIGNYALAGRHLADRGTGDADKLKELFDKIAAQCVRATALTQELRQEVHVEMRNTSAPLAQTRE